MYCIGVGGLLLPGGAGAGDMLASLAWQVCSVYLLYCTRVQILALFTGTGGRRRARQPGLAGVLFFLFLSDFFNFFLIFLKRQYLYFFVPVNNASICTLYQ